MRLDIAEADRFPELACSWYERGFRRGLASLAARLKDIADRGGLRVSDPTRPRPTISPGLTLWVPVNRAMFCGQGAGFSAAELEGFVSAGVDAFSAAYGGPAALDGGPHFGDGEERRRRRPDRVGLHDGHAAHPLACNRHRGPGARHEHVRYRVAHPVEPEVVAAEHAPG